MLVIAQVVVKGGGGNVIHAPCTCDLPHYVSDCTEYESCSFNLKSCDLHVLVLYSQKYDINSVNYVVDYYLYLLYNIVFSFPPPPFTTTCAITNIVSSNTAYGKVYSIKIL
jgi:hypothetical protein